ncbi:phytanoyl-CoA dioxygenase [Leptomonas pyrrhocoris]|uniref:Phytanoyl-CoA dioxygenase n=1 Tax=Leptomonas pyrrhocoris TaxID=157538 RepID=A0A0N0DXR5_LEPPY|nr:phytanoyl-CoA dioxygenase [Leptomonas pyrrhocoris]KPA83285.1 phytanoyl-CoA dioxygenase [Leptomonas pyrrhocoris]|eukprot:XP_015661724.1 phytanoyl-CoA dioxygenase [Leptomonas pyrrhocoris]
MPVHLTAADARDFQQCGVAFIRHALTPGEVDVLRCGIDGDYRNSNIDPNCAGQGGRKGTKVFEDFPAYRNHPEYWQIAFQSELPRIAAQLTGSRTIRLHHVQVHVDVPKDEVRTPWHSDELFFNVDGNQNVSIFVAVDPIPAGSAEFVLGSNKWPATMPRFLRDMFAKDLPVSAVPEPPNIETARNEFPVVSWAMEPGDCVVFSLHTLHFLRSSTALRRGLSVRYMGDDAVYARRPWMTFPAFPELERDNEGMEVGAPMRHSVYPIVYTTETKL